MWASWGQSVYHGWVHLLSLLGLVVSWPSTNRKVLFASQVLTLLLESNSAKDLACLIAGYYRLFVDPANSVFLWSGNRQQIHRVSAEEGEVLSLFPRKDRTIYFQPRIWSLLDIRIFKILLNGTLEGLWFPPSFPKSSLRSIISYFLAKRRCPFLRRMPWSHPCLCSLSHSLVCDRKSQPYIVRGKGHLGTKET